MRLSEQNRRMAETSSTCNCNVCDAKLSFDSSCAGEQILCPTCGQETVLNILRDKPPVIRVVNRYVEKTVSGIGLICPFCKNSDKFYSRKPISTGGIIVMLFGIALTPVLVGIILIIVGLQMKQQKYQCDNCKKTF